MCVLHEFGQVSYLLLHQVTLVVGVTLGIIPYVSATIALGLLIPIQSPSVTKRSESNCMFW